MCYHDELPSCFAAGFPSSRWKSALRDAPCSPARGPAAAGPGGIGSANTLFGANGCARGSRLHVARKILPYSLSPSFAWWYVAESRGVYRRIRECRKRIFETTCRPRAVIFERSPRTVRGFFFFAAPVKNTRWRQSDRSIGVARANARSRRGFPATAHRPNAMKFSTGGRKDSYSLDRRRYVIEARE